MAEIPKGDETKITAIIECQITEDVYKNIVIKFWIHILWKY